MRTCTVLTILLVAFGVMACAQQSSRSLQDWLLGSWTCKSGECWDDEVEFSLEEGQRRWRTWLHHRPGTTGTWEISGKQLTVSCCGGTVETWRVLLAGSEELKLKGEEGEIAVYKRMPEE